MNIKHTLTVGAIAAGIALGAAGIAFGQTNANTPPPSRWEGLAKILGVSTEELKTDFGPKKTIEQIAQEKGISLADVEAKLEAARATQMKARLDSMVSSGNITQAQADAQATWQASLGQWMKDHPAPLKEVFKDKDMMGFGGHGFGRGHHGFGFQRMMR